MLKLKLKLLILVILSLSSIGCVMEAYNSQARENAKSWIGVPIQELISRDGEPQSVTGSAEKRRYIWKSYADYSYDYDYNYYEPVGSTPNGVVLQEKTITTNKSGYYTCISEYYVNAAGIIIDATARGECQ